MRQFFLLAAAACLAKGHTIVRSIYVNGVDQGTNVGIRPPAMNGPPRAGEPPFIDGSDSGTGSWPVKDLNLPDLQCNIFGEIPAPETIHVVPGDIVSFEWGHRNRGPSDGIIDASHKGPIVVYLSESPAGPTGRGWVKIFEEGEYSRGNWAIVPKLRNNRGVHSIRIPPNLKSGYYLLRPELITLHEADVAYTQNSARGVQIYTECVQIYVGGNGNVTLPAGVHFPGAYKYTDPGLVYNIYSPPSSGYKIPGPPVWPGAAPSVANPPLGSKKGPLTYTRWSTWVGSYDRVVTKTGAGGLTRTAYNPVWPTQSAWGNVVGKREVEAGAGPAQITPAPTAV